MQFFLACGGPSIYVATTSRWWPGCSHLRSPEIKGGTPWRGGHPEWYPLIVNFTHQFILNSKVWWIPQTSGKNLSCYFRLYHWDGCCDGCSVGCCVGSSDGDSVGATEGDSVVQKLSFWYFLLRFTVAICKSSAHPWVIHLSPSSSTPLINLMI